VAWRLLADLLLALTAAHRASILHLDVKPANVLLDGNGGFVLADFGISQGGMVSRRVVSTGLGTQYYQSPEQQRMAHESFDARTDLWGVGITLWRAVTGVPLWARQDVFLEPSRDGVCGLKRPSELKAGCSPELDSLIAGLLAIDPDKRPGSAAEVLDRAQAHAGMGIAFVPSSAMSRPAAADDPEVVQLVDSLIDPLWVSLSRVQGFMRFFVKFEDGEYLCREGEKSFHAFVLMRGTVCVEREGSQLHQESREGTFLGEVTALTGTCRTASLRAKGPVWTCVFNAAELERFVTCNPAVGIRLIKSLAERVVRESARKQET
jgi:serine/threonine protein kinase